MNTVISKKIIIEIENEFCIKSKTVFGGNLSFSFVFGGLAKGYANYEHDIDMFVCLHQRNTAQEELFKKFYFDLHKQYKLPPDYIDPVEFTTEKELQIAFKFLNKIKIRRVIRSFEEYEAIVWGDIFSGRISAQTGDLDLLASMQHSCLEYPAKWRSEIMKLVDQKTLEKEGRLLPDETLETLNTTRLFRRCVTYLKRSEPAKTFQYKKDKIHICILGGGGNVAEAVAAHLTAKGHDVSQFRLDEHIDISGVPKRSKRSAQRLKTTKFINVSGQDCELQDKQVNWIGVDQFDDVDVFILGYPSFMAEKLAEIVGARLAGKPLVNLSDRFLGSYSLLHKISKLYGENALPLFTIGFNGVPIMALKENRDAPTSIYYVKPKHSIAWYPVTRKREVYSLLSSLFHFKSDQLIPYSSMLHLGFENAHCIEHAVADLYNLELQQYNNDDGGGGFLYSKDMYPEVVVNRIAEVINDRDKVAQRVIGKSFYSLKDYDIKVFGGNGVSTVGSSNFRIQHPSLSKAPNLMKTTAFGYEDVGWSMVTLESIAHCFNIDTPALTQLIDEWNKYMKCDYRLTGRTIQSLGLVDYDISMKLDSYKDLSWFPYFFLDT